MRRPLSSLHPILYHAIVFIRRTHRHLQWLLSKGRFAAQLSETPLAYRVKKHQSVLIRRLGDSDIRLQENKVENLKIALKKINGIHIRPGETFSFCYLVGKTTEKKGYKNGMMLTNGRAVEGVGGGLCQITNLIHWLVIHSPLDVTERHHHSFDPFPDSGRVVPFGSGATVFYNYIDFQFANNTPYLFQLLFWLDKKCINGDLRINEPLDYKYSVAEKNHRFVLQDGQWYRQNEIWRKKTSKKDGSLLDFQCVLRNFSRVMYTPGQDGVASQDGAAG